MRAAMLIAEPTKPPQRVLLQVHQLRPDERLQLNPNCVESASRAVARLAA